MGREITYSPWPPSRSRHRTIPQRPPLDSPRTQRLSSKQHVVMGSCTSNSHTLYIVKAITRCGASISRA